MARKNPFANILADENASPEDDVLDYTIKGASRSLISSIDEMASRADSLLQGETIVELDPDSIDESFVRDRLENDEAEFQGLVEAIRERGQDSPILVRPHPKETGRYMVVFGHRRLRAAKLLARKVRAVVKDVKDRDHVIAQGQENTARANLSFIERARFAASLAKLQYDDDNATVFAALSTDRASLSKMLSVASLPSSILNWIGAAKNVGRDRWYELKLLLDNPSLQAVAFDIVKREELQGDHSDDRFDFLISRLKAEKTTKRPKAQSIKRNWTPSDGTMSAEMLSDGKRFNLALKSKGTDARAFGEYLTENLEQFYKAFRQSGKATESGE